MRTEYVQGRPKESESGRPVHAVWAVLDEQAGEYELEPRTHCNRLPVEELVPIGLPLQPFVNAPPEDRCATCQMLITQAFAGQPLGVAMREIPRVEMPVARDIPETDDPEPLTDS